MPAPERLFDVVAYETGLPVPGERLAIALRFQLRDGATVAFALPPEIAAGLVQQIAAHLRTLADRPNPASH